VRLADTLTRDCIRACGKPGARHRSLPLACQADGHWGPIGCGADAECPPDFSCTLLGEEYKRQGLACPPDGTCARGTCQQRTCKTSRDCDHYCVEGRCYAEPGHCVPCCRP
jgi:hypothetical protein